MALWWIFYYNTLFHNKRSEPQEEISLIVCSESQWKWMLFKTYFPCRGLPLRHGIFSISSIEWCLFDHLIVLVIAFVLPLDANWNICRICKEKGIWRLSLKASKTLRSLEVHNYDKIFIPFVTNDETHITIDISTKSKDSIDNIEKMLYLKTHSFTKNYNTNFRTVISSTKN